MAGNAVREGLDHAKALQAVTVNVADAFGMPKHGRIAKGAWANLVVWSGDPFAATTRADVVLTGGRIAVE